jgi:hypothetical protein
MVIRGYGNRTAYNFLSDLEELEILTDVTGSKKGKVYAFKKYLNQFS